MGTCIAEPARGAGFLLWGRPDDKTPADLLETLTQHHEPIGTLDNAAKIFVRD